VETEGDMSATALAIDCRRVRDLALLLGTLLAIFCLACGWRWSKTDQFVQGLKCGMSATEIRSLAEKFSGSEVYERDSPNLPQLVVKHGGTRILCWLEAGKLKAVQVTWIREPMSLKTERQRDLCPSQKP
jgi:hypothetical protein